MSSPDVQDQVKLLRDQYEQLCSLAFAVCQEYDQALRGEYEGSKLIESSYAVRRLKNFITGGGTISIQEFIFEELADKVKAPSTDVLCKMIERRLKASGLDGPRDGWNSDSVMDHLKDMKMLLTVPQGDGDWALLEVRTPGKHHG